MPAAYTKNLLVSARPQISPGTGTHEFSHHGFTIYLRKLPISKSGKIDELSAELGIPLPEMIFGDNEVLIIHEASGWSIDFNTPAALDCVDKTGESMLQVAHSAEWQRTRERKHEGITEVVKPFDWTYTTDYKGSLYHGSPAFEPTTTPIPLHLLKLPDPILYYDEIVLFADEMADNGETMLSIKIRVMEERMLLLSRHFMRLDNVLLRIHDTRIFIEFATGEVIREHLFREDTYKSLKEKVTTKRPYDAPEIMRDGNSLVAFLPIMKKSLERLVLDMSESVSKKSDNIDSNSINSDINDSTSSVEKTLERLGLDSSESDSKEDRARTP